MNFQDDDEILDEVKLKDQRRIRWTAVFLLAVMLCGIISTPIAILYRYIEINKTRTVDAQEGKAEAFNRIVFVSPDQQLVSIDPDGDNRRLHTDGSSGFGFPTWSPDGRHIAAVSNDSVYLIRYGGPQGDNSTTRIYQNDEQPPFYLYWSPDSSQISFLANHPSGIALHLASIKENDATEKTVAVGQPFYWDWTPDSENVLIHTGFSGPEAKLELLPLDHQVPSMSYSRPGFFQAPGISTDGTLHAFAVLDGEGERKIVIQNTEGAELVAEAHFGQAAMGWSPQENLLAYTSPAFQSSSFYGPLAIINANSGEIKVLVQEAVVAFFWSPDGQSIAYLSLPRTNDGSIQAWTKGSVGSRLGKNSRQHHGLQLTLWVVDVSSGFRRQLMTFEPTAIFVRQFLPFFDQYALSHRLWAPDSSALVLPVNQNDRAVITVVPLDDAGPRVIADGDMGFWSHR